MGAAGAMALKFPFGFGLVLDEFVISHGREKISLQTVEDRLSIAQIDIGAGGLSSGGFLDDAQHQPLHVGTRRVLAFEIEFVFLVHPGKDFLEIPRCRRSCSGPTGRAELPSFFAPSMISPSPSNGMAAQRMPR